MYNGGKNMFTLPDSYLIGDSENYQNWMSALSLTTCPDCYSQHGKVYVIDSVKFTPCTVGANAELLG